MEFSTIQMNESPHANNHAEGISIYDITLRNARRYHDFISRGSLPHETPFVDLARRSVAVNWLMDGL